MESKKEFSTEKLNLFLNKIDKKLDSEQNKDIVGNENKDILKQWINEFNNSKEKKITVDINKEIYEKNMNMQKDNFNLNIEQNNKMDIEINNENNEGLTKENFEKKFKEKIDILIDEKTSISKKEEIITIIDKYYLNHLNIKNKIFSSEIENILISLLDVCPDDKKIIDDKNTSFLFKFYTFKICYHNILKYL